MINWRFVISRFVSGRWLMIGRSLVINRRFVVRRRFMIGRRLVVRRRLIIGRQFLVGCRFVINRLVINRDEQVARFVPHIGRVGRIGNPDRVVAGEHNWMSEQEPGFKQFKGETHLLFSRNCTNLPKLPFGDILYSQQARSTTLGSRIVKIGGAAVEKEGKEHCPPIRWI